jgi:preprotein translocase subunit YajC
MWGGDFACVTGADLAIIGLASALDTCAACWLVRIPTDRENVMVELAFAQTQGAAPGGAGGIFGTINMLVPFIAMFAIFYFLLIRPQQKKQKEHRQMLQNLKRGDRVLTSGGIYGTIIRIRNDIIHLEVADQVRVRVNKGSISDLVAEGEKVFEEFEESKKG